MAVLGMARRPKSKKGYRRGIMTELPRDRRDPQVVAVRYRTLVGRPRREVPVADLQRPLLRLRHWLAITSMLAIAVVVLRFEGHRWWCRCGRLSPWSGDIHSAHNSQHLLDPYSFTHVLHGFLLFALLYPLMRKLGTGSRLVLALALETLWEVVENTNSVVTGIVDSVC